MDKSAVIETCGLEEFCKGLSEICDVYAVSGNHERWDKHSEKWKQMLKDNNIKLLRDEYIKIERNGQELVLMGLIDNTSYNPDIFENIEEIADSYKILLAHRPELWQTYCSDSYEIKPDLIFSGHAHGGQFVIPFIGGVVAPSQEYFPKYTSGLYELDNGVKMIVSRGLGNSVIPIRINNRPHIPVIILGKE